ncbi:MAG: hypothetical protein EOO88_07900, partial [Pedobacter sp.]
MAKAVSLKATLENNDHFSLFSEYDISLFKAGRHYQLYNKLGSHIVSWNGQTGTISGPDGVDTVVNVEFLKFSDQ